MELRAMKAWYTSREGLITLDDDVLSIVSQIRERYGDRVRVCWEPTTESYVLSEMCADGVERLIFTTPSLDGRVLERLMRDDAHSRGFQDPYDAAEIAQDAMQGEIDNQYTQYIREATERLTRALKREGKEPRLPATVVIPRGINADR